MKEFRPKGPLVVPHPSTEPIIGRSVGRAGRVSRSEEEGETGSHYSMDNFGFHSFISGVIKMFSYWREGWGSIMQAPEASELYTLEWGITSCMNFISINKTNPQASGRLQIERDKVSVENCRCLKDEERATFLFKSNFVYIHSFRHAYKGDIKIY